MDRQEVLKIQYPLWHLKKTPLYHITHLDNLKRILKPGCLLAKNFITDNHESIAHSDIQDKRAKVIVPHPPGGSLHDYVPFYFAPRSPMLLKNNTDSQPKRRNQPDALPNAKPQHEIIYLVTFAESIGQNNIPYVFYDQHPVKSVASCFNNIKDLNKIAWDIFYEEPLTGDYSTVWKDDDDINHPLWLKRKDLRQAEFLVHNKLDLHHIVTLGTMVQKVNDEVQKIMASSGVKIRTEIREDWYY